MNIYDTFCSVFVVDFEQVDYSQIFRLKCAYTMGYKHVRNKQYSLKLLKKAMFMEVTCGEMPLQVKAVKNIRQCSSVLLEMNVCHF